MGNFRLNGLFRDQSNSSSLWTERVLLQVSGLWPLIPAFLPLLRSPAIEVAQQETDQMEA
jgi:hypothetical protein